jgi:hypothetical protein
MISELQQKPMLLGVFLVFATLLLYSPVAEHQFLQFDDGNYVTQNTHVSTGLKLDNMRWAFTSFYESNWHPLTWLSHMVDCQLFALNPKYHHLVNIALHAANVLLLFFLLQKATAAVWRSFFVAALFAFHPLNVETVAWVAERKSLLCTFFSLLTIAAYGWYVRRPDWKRYLVIIAAFSLALMSKPMAVSLPLVLLLLDYWPLERFEDLPFRRRWAHLSIEKLPLLLMSAASSAITMAAQLSGGSVAETSGLPLSLRLGNAMVSYVAYIGKTFWPARLAPFYPHPEHSIPWPEVVAAMVILVAITAGVSYFYRARYLVVGWFLFVTTLVPVIGIVQVGRQAMADRYTYVPCIGLFIIIAWGSSAIVDAAAVPWVLPPVAVLCLVVALAVATTRYLRYWQNGVNLFTHASIVVGPTCAIEEELGDEIYSAGRTDEAFSHYREACLLRPNYAICHYNMAAILFDRDQLWDALEQYQLAVRFTNRKEIALPALINSGKILMKLGDYKTAGMRFAAALQIDPGNNTALSLYQQMSSQEEH